MIRRVWAVLLSPRAAREEAIIGELIVGGLDAMAAVWVSGHHPGYIL